MGSWDVQAYDVDCRLSFANEFAFAFDVNEPGSRRGAEVLPEEGSKVSERKPLCGWSEFFGPRHDCYDKRSIAGQPALRAGRRTRR